MKHSFVSVKANKHYAYHIKNRSPRELRGSHRRNCNFSGDFICRLKAIDTYFLGAMLGLAGVINDVGTTTSLLFLGFFVSLFPRC